MDGKLNQLESRPMYINYIKDILLLLFVGLPIREGEIENLLFFPRGKE
jgi:hypothetical protein